MGTTTRAILREVFGFSFERFHLLDHVRGSLGNRYPPKQSREIWEQMGDSQETKFEINKWMQVDISGCYPKLKSCQNAAVYNCVYMYIYI